MQRHRCVGRPTVSIAILVGILILFGTSPTAAQPPDNEAQGPPSLKEFVDAPLLFVKRHPYFAGHIYDDYITWHPGGGIYVLENPWEAPEKHRIRAIIDPTTNETLGEGVYRDPDLSWHAKTIVFAFKGQADGHTCIYEIGIDGSGLRRLTNPDTDCPCQPQEDRTGKGHHDVTPCYLPDGRIAFTSTRPRALVPCFNSGVDTLHVMDADGSNIRSISVNNVNEFDPAALPDGRILYGRWEYVDKTALYMQSLWTISPDGRMEEAFFANNLAKPTAVLDARPVPGSHLIAAALTPHNGQAVGAIVTIDPRQGKNNLAAITNFTPEYPTKMDQGLRQGPCDPWPLSEDLMLISNNAKGHAQIQIIHRDGHRELVYADPDISCYAPIPVKPRSQTPALSSAAEADLPGQFLVTDIYRGLQGVERGTIKRLRIVEETARTSGLPPGGRWWNQAFLVSWQGAYIIKNILGTVPVHDDGSAYFEAPAGRALYFEALDENNCEVQRMRSFVQAVPGVTRACVGCHEHKSSTASSPSSPPLAMLSPPARLEPESWGSGFVDYPTMIQPVLDKHCVRCHGGGQDIAKGIDLSGGWTWAFNISYETLIKHRLVGFLNCNNGSVHTSEILPPNSIGSGAAPLAELLLTGHDGHIEGMTRPEIDLVLAWMDTNSNYYGSWDYTLHATANPLMSIVAPLSQAMNKAGCAECHSQGHIGNDWVNLQRPQWSRILRAPMARSDDGPGLAMCRKRKARNGYPLVNQRVQPPDIVRPSQQPPWDDSGEVQITFDGPADPHFQEMLDVIRQTRGEVLARPRVDMPGAAIVGGTCRMQVMPELPPSSPPLAATAAEDGSVELSWPRSAETIGFQYELHRAKSPKFAPGKSTQIGLTTAGRFTDAFPSSGTQHYALVLTSDSLRGKPSYVELKVPLPPPPAAPTRIVARASPGEVHLSWQSETASHLRYHVLRKAASDEQLRQLNDEPLAGVAFSDVDVLPDIQYTYAVRAIDRRGQVGPISDPASAVAKQLIREPVFVAPLTSDATGRLWEGETVKGHTRGQVGFEQGAAQLGPGGYIHYQNRPEFDLRHALSVECWVRIDEPSQMPVILACGEYQKNGWFVQRFGNGWRWHLGGASCDGGKPVVGEWLHLAATFDGRTARLYQNGTRVAQTDCQPNRGPSGRPLFVGQYTSAGPQYQVLGRIAGVKIYQRTVSPEEIAAACQAGPPSE